MKKGRQLDLTALRLHRGWLTLATKKENRFRRAVIKVSKRPNVAPKRRKVLVSVTRKQTRIKDFI